MEEVVREFNKKYYDSHIWKNTKWKGINIAKAPTDLWQYQEIIFETKPNIIIETGTWCGGSALFFAQMLKGGGRVITIDNHPESIRRVKEEIGRVDILPVFGSSIDSEVFKYVKSVYDYGFDGVRVMVVLDSDHSKAHVLKELELYAPLVTQGCYLIVEDTNVNGNPVLESHGPGPMEAVNDWLRTEYAKNFEVDRYRERFLLTFNPYGYLKRVK